MGDLGVDTAVTPVGDGCYEGRPTRDWEIWGPMGGYIASFAVRAAGVEAAERRPTAFSCHYLGVAAFEPVQIRVETRKPGRVAQAQRVEITQDGRPILDAMVWSTQEVEGLEHDETEPPDVPGPDGLPSVEELVGPDTAPPFPFWENFDSRPLDFLSPWPPTEPHRPTWRNWLRFAPTATFADPWIDACRSVILVDIPSWPAGHRPHAWREPPFIAPTLDLNVAFHRPTSAEEWLLCDGTAPLSTGGLLPWTARVWSPSGQLHASGGGQCLYRRTPPPA
ncbi:acyl-CoA thioesterase [Aquihabitans daechungensis]|uniref:acyl-CoA thioesterase n=1 Tax=Aquihabitans daechungensis TaxID=1052257 RepID=UPI003BA315F4